MAVALAEEVKVTVPVAVCVDVVVKVELSLIDGLGEADPAEDKDMLAVELSEALAEGEAEAAPLVVPSGETELVADIEAVSVTETDAE